MSRTTRTTKTLAVIGTAGALLTPVAFAVPAQAGAPHDGCTVTAGRPYHAGYNDSGVSLIRRQVTFTCDADRTVTYESKFYEQDIEGRTGDGNPADDFIGVFGDDLTFGAVGSTRTVTLERAVPRPVPDETGLTGEFFQIVKFRVESNGVQGGWSPQEFSLVRSIQI